MIIKQVELKNFQTIENFSADFEGNIYFITGENEIGKSTLLKAIGVLLTGERDAVLKIGKEKGFAKMIIGADGNEYKVELNFTKKNPRGTLLITDPSGMKSERLEMLNKIFGYIDFDAVDFSRWSETAEGRRKQVKVIKQLLPENVRQRIEQIDTDIKAYKDNRALINSSIKQLKGSRDSFSISEKDLDKYDKRIELSDLLKEANEVAELNRKAELVRGAIIQRTEQLNEIPSKIEKLEEKLSSDLEEIQRLRAELDEREKNIVDDYKNERKNIIDSGNDYKRRLENAKEWIKEYESMNKNDNIDKRIDEIEQFNKMVDVAKNYKAVLSELKVVEKQAQEVVSNIDKLTCEREELIKTSSLPINGLSFTDDGLELNGVPFSPGNVSDSQIMEVATQLIIASNPTVKVFRIARGESLGESRLRDIINIAKKNGFQGFIEEVKRGQNELQIEEYTEG